MKSTRTTLDTPLAPRLWAISCLLGIGFWSASIAGERPHADNAVASRHWSLQPRAAVSIPSPANPADQRWIRSDVDAFVLQRLRDAGLEPAPEAGRQTLIRRLSLDLIGLPPTPEEIDSFVSDPAPDAVEQLVDRLLASPHYGERWGQHWLDVVRFSETEGFEYDRHRPGAWRYRDYVIQAFNDDKPFDRFITEQLAGDELDPNDRTMQVAVGFHRLGPVRRNAGNPDVAFSRNEVLTEMTSAVGSVFLGVTLACARCHDHKFDAIPQRDFYRMQAFLAATHENDIPVAGSDEVAAWQARTDEIKAQIEATKKELKQLEGDARTALMEKLEQLTAELPEPLPSVCSVKNDDAQRSPIHLLRRGDEDQRGEPVGMRTLSALTPDDRPELPADTPLPRTELARWITDPSHPLTARVLVNRVWQYHFGQGLVSTPNDFGVNGDRPSHPELLDYLAAQFVQHGWRLKPIHRLICLSSTYRQSARAADEPLSRRVDPENRLLSHFERRRLDAEQLRDAMLMVAGRLNRRTGGPSVIVPVEAELVNLLYKPSQWTVTPDPEEHERRSVYLIAKRNLRLPFLEVFDQPDLQTSCAGRESSTHAPQALELLNGPLANDLAASFARRLRQEAGDDTDRQIELAFRLAAGRGPSERERELAERFLAAEPLEEFALAIFNLNAFLYVE